MRNTKGTKESQTTIYGSFGTTRFRRKARALSPPIHHHAPQCSIVVKQQGLQTTSQLTGHILPAVISALLLWLLLNLLPLPPSFSRLLFFLKVLGSQQNQEEETKISQSPLPSHMHSLPIITGPHQSDTFVTVKEPTLTHLNHP